MQGQYAGAQSGLVQHSPSPHPECLAGAAHCLKRGEEPDSLSGEVAAQRTASPSLGLHRPGPKTQGPGSPLPLGLRLPCPRWRGCPSPGTNRILVTDDETPIVMTHLYKAYV